MHPQAERDELARNIDRLMAMPVAPMPAEFPRRFFPPSSNPPDQPASGEHERED